MPVDTRWLCHGCNKYYRESDLQPQHYDEQGARLHMVMAPGSSSIGWCGPMERMLPCCNQHPRVLVPAPVRLGRHWHFCGVCGAEHFRPPRLVEA